MSWAMVALALQGLGVASSIAGGQAAKKAEKAQKRAIRAEWEQEFYDMNREFYSVRGEQDSRYAASNVVVGVGSAGVIAKQTRDDYTRVVAANAYLTQQRLKGVEAESKATRYAQIGGYFSSLASMANSYSQYKGTKPR